MFVCFSVSHVLVAKILSSFESGGPLSRFPTPLKRALIEPMVEIMTQNHQIMTAVDMSMTRTTLVRNHILTIYSTDPKHKRSRVSQMVTGLFVEVKFMLKARRTPAIPYRQKCGGWIKLASRLTRVPHVVVLTLSP